MNSRQESNARIKSRRNHRQGTALAGARNAQRLPVVLRQRTDKIHSTQSAYHHTVIVRSIPAVAAERPVIAQRPTCQRIIYRLLHRDGNAVDTHLQCNHLSRSRIRISRIRADTRTGHTQQSRILPFFLGNTENTVKTSSPSFCLEADLIYIIRFRTAFGKQRHKGIQRSLARLFQGLGPIIPKIGRKFRHRLQLLGSIGRCSQPFISPAVHMRLDLATQEACSLHRALQLQGTIFQHHVFLYFSRIHLGAQFIVNLDIGQEVLCLQHPDGKRTLLIQTIHPIAMVR